MRVLIMAKMTPQAETVAASAAPPSKEGMEAIMRFHQELSEAGVLLDTGRLAPSAMGARVSFKGASRTVTDGPFLEAKELVGGFWLWKVDSMDEAVEWLKRAPFEGGEFEIRAVHDPEGMG